MNAKRNAMAAAVLATMIGFTSATAGTADRISGPMHDSRSNHWYYLLSSSNWTDAEQEAVRLGGHLVTIDDPRENDWVLQTFGNFGVNFNFLVK